VLTYYSRASAASHSSDSILLLCSTSSFALLDKNYLTPIFTLRNLDCDDDTTESQSPSKRTRPCSIDTLSLKIFLTLFPFLVIQHLQSEPLLTCQFLGTNYSSWVQNADEELTVSRGPGDLEVHDWWLQIWSAYLPGIYTILLVPFSATQSWKCNQTRNIALPLLLSYKH
jgi:hypothetical protein